MSITSKLKLEKFHVRRSVSAKFYKMYEVEIKNLNSIPSGTVAKLSFKDLERCIHSTSAIFTTKKDNLHLIKFKGIFERIANASQLGMYCKKKTSLLERSRPQLPPASPPESSPNTLSLEAVAM